MKEQYRLKENSYKAQLNEDMISCVNDYFFNDFKNDREINDKDITDIEANNFDSAETGVILSDDDDSNSDDTPFHTNVTVWGSDGNESASREPYLVRQSDIYSSVCRIMTPVLIMVCIILLAYIHGIKNEQMYKSQDYMQDDPAVTVTVTQYSAEETQITETSADDISHEETSAASYEKEIISSSETESVSSAADNTTLTDDTTATDERKKTSSAVVSKINTDVSEESETVISETYVSDEDNISDHGSLPDA